MQKSMNGFPTTYIWDQRLQIIQIQLIMDEKIFHRVEWK